MNFNDELLFGCDSMTEGNESFIVDCRSFKNENVDFKELQSTANSYNGTLPENDRNLLDGWNMGFLFQTCLSESYKFIALIVVLMCQ